MKVNKLALSVKPIWMMKIALLISKLKQDSFLIKKITLFI